MSVRPRTVDDLPAVAALLARQANALEAVDSRLRPIRAQATGDALVAVRAGRIVGHLAYAPFTNDPDGFDAVWSPNRGISLYALALDDPTAFDALLVGVLAAGAGTFDTVTIMWPSADPAPYLSPAGFSAGSSYTLRDPGPLPARPVDGVVMRDADRADTETLVALYLEEIAFHEAHTPLVRLTKGAEPGWRDRLRELFDGARGPDATLLVAEAGGEVIGFSEGWLSTDDLYVPGRYGYLNSVCVHAPHRGRGLGRLLAGALVERLGAYGTDGSTLWFTCANPVSSRVWPHLGFAPLWTLYLRPVPRKGR